MGVRRLLALFCGLVVMASLLVATPAVAPVAAVAGSGDWVGGVGGDGFALVGMNGGADVAQFPMAEFRALTRRYVWEDPSSDSRALESPDQSGRVAATWYSYGTITLTLTFHQDYAGPMRLYGVDFDSDLREQTVTVSQGSTVVASEDWAGFNDGHWMAADIDVVAGDVVTIRATRTKGANSVLSGIFLGDAVPSQDWAVVQGDWIGSYGSDGYVIVGATQAEEIVVIESARLVWYQPGRSSKTDHDVDRRALMSPADGSRQMAAMDGGAWVIGHLHFSEPYSGPISFYAVDWETQRTEQEIKVTTVAQGPQSQTITGFEQGAWVTFNIDAAAEEAVEFRADRTVGSATLSGVFLGGHGPPHVPSHTKVQGNWRHLTGADGYVLADQVGDDTMPQADVTISVPTTLHEEVTADQRGLVDGSSRQGASWIDNVYFHVDLRFTEDYSGTLHAYGVDWDQYDRSQEVQLFLNGQHVATEIWNTMHHGAWAEFPINVTTGDILRIRPSRSGGTTGASLSGVFLGDSAAGTYIGQFNDASGIECAVAGGNIFFDQPFVLEASGVSYHGCYNLDTCIPTVPADEIFGPVQVLGCEFHDELVDFLDMMSKPYEERSTLARWLLSPTDAAASAFTVVARPGAARLAVETVGTTVGSVAIIPAGVLTVSGVAELAEAVVDTESTEYDRQTETIGQVVEIVGPGPDGESTDDQDLRRFAAAQECVAKLASTAIIAGLDDYLLEAFGLDGTDGQGNEIGFNSRGYIYNGPNDGKHLCELIPIYMPGPKNYKGSSMPITHRHIREALYHAAETVQPPEQLRNINGPDRGLRRSASWHILTYAFNETHAESGWYKAFLPCKGNTTTLICDEFPFRRTLQAGRYKSEQSHTGQALRVASLRLTPPNEGSSQGVDLSGFLGAGGCNIPKKAETASISPLTAWQHLAANAPHNYFVLPLPGQSSINSQFICD